MADEAEEVNLSDEDSNGEPGGKKKKGGKKGRKVMGPPRIISGQIGNKIMRGEPAIGPIHPIPTIKVPYHTAAEPVMLRRECIGHVSNSNYDHERDKLLNKSDLSFSQAYASARRAISSDGSRKKVAHMAWLAIPACNLAPNPSTLVDFRTDTPTQMLWAASISFYLSALSDDSVHTTSEQRDRSISLERGMFVDANGSIHPRCQAFVHRIFAPDAHGNSTWEELVSSLPGDPLPGVSAEEIARVKKPNVFTVNHVNHPSRFVGYLVQIVYHDETLHPGVQIERAILRNRNLKGVDNLEMYEQNLENLFFRTNYEAAKMREATIGAPPDEKASKGAPPAAYGLDDPAAPPKKGENKDEEMHDDDEAEDVGSDVNVSDLDKEAEAREANAIRKKVEKRAEQTRANPADTEEGRRFLERMQKIVQNDPASKRDAPMIEESEFEKNRRASSDRPAAAAVASASASAANIDQDSTSDGGSYEAAKDDASSSHTADEDMSDHGPPETPPPGPDEMEEDNSIEEGDKEEDDNNDEEDKGKTMDELLKEAEEENGGEEDSEERREIEEELAKEKARNGGSKRKAAAKKGRGDSDEARKLDAEERALKEESDRLKKKAAANGADDASRRFALDKAINDEAVKSQHAKEKSATKHRGGAYHDFEHARMQIAMRSQETLPFLKGRGILNLRLYSQVAVDAYLRAADSPECKTHPNGLYDTEENLRVKVYEYNMNVRSPLHYSNVLSFENARRILLRSFPGRIGIVSAAESPQFDYFCYAGIPDEPFLSVPFPWLATRYLPADLDPETLASFRPPGLRSAVDAIIERARTEEERDKSNYAAANNFLKTLYEHPRAPTIARSKRKAVGDDQKKAPGDVPNESLSSSSSSSPPSGPAPLTNSIILSELMDQRRRVRKEASLMTTEQRRAASNRGKIQTLLMSEIDDDSRRLNEEIDTRSDLPKNRVAADHNESAYGSAPSIRSVDPSGGVAVAPLPPSSEVKDKASGGGEQQQQQAAERVLRWRKQSEQDQLSWLESASRTATNADDRRLITSALNEIRGKQGDERTSALAALVSGTGYAGVADLCAKAHTQNSDGMAILNEHAGSAIAERDAPPHPTNAGAAAMCAGEGDRVSLATKQLSEFIVNGPIDKLAAQRAAIYTQLVDLSLKRPLRSDIASMREWLDRQCPDWRDDPAVKACTQAQADACRISLEDYFVLVGMNYKREERLRHEWLSEARAVFCAESGDEVCSTLSVNNDDLSDSLRGLLVYVNTRKGGRVFVRPTPTFDPTLTPLATAYVRDIAVTYGCKALNEHFAPKLMHMLWNERVSMLQSKDGRLPDVLMLHGPPGCGKSRLFIVIKDAGPPSYMLAAHHSSKLSLMTVSGGSINQTTTLNHEAPTIWVEGTRADPHNREQANMIKSVTTEQACDFRRNAEGPDGRRVLEKYHVVYHHNVIMGTNYFTAPPDVKDRMLYGTSMYTADSDRGAMLKRTVFSKSGNEKRLEELWRNERWDEMAVIAIVEAMISGKALPDVDLSVYESVSAAGQAEIGRFTGEITISHRPEESATNEARQYVLQRTFHVFFRSEVSPFITLTYDQDPKTGEKIPRLSMNKPREFLARDLPTMIPTSLCCSYGEAIPAYFSLLYNKLLPYDQWRLLCVIGWRMGGFTDDYFHASYYRHGIALPDVLGRANQRRRPESARITSRRDTCSFLCDYYDNFETALRRHAETNQTMNESFRKNRKRPNFASAKQFARICQGINQVSSVNEDNPNSQTPAGDKPGQQQPAASLDPDLNPSLIYILLKPTLDESVASILAACKGLIHGIDNEVIKSLLMDLSLRPPITAPLHKSVKASEILAAELGFQGVKPRAGTAPHRGMPFFEPLELDSQKVHYSEMPLFSFGMDAFQKRYYLAISTYGLMVKWPELMYMALTSHEGPHTRRARCVLPVGHVKAPLHMHIWNTAPNPHGNSAGADVATWEQITHESHEAITAKSVLPGDHDARDRLRCIREQANETDARLYDISRFDKASDDASKSGVKFVNPLSTMDLEMTAFVKHLVNIHYIPPKAVEQPPAEIQDILARYAYIAPRLLCAPGNVETRIQQLRKTCPDLKSEDSDPSEDADYVYPRSYVDSTVHRNDHRNATADFEHNPEQTIDSDAWASYLTDMFDENDLDEKTSQYKKEAEAVKAIEDARRGDPSIEHHRLYPGVMISFLIWKKEYDRVKALSKNTTRIEILSSNELTLIAKNAFMERSGYDTIYDYLSELRYKRKQDPPSVAPPETPPKKSNAAAKTVPVTPPAAAATVVPKARRDMASSQQAPTEGESSMDGLEKKDVIAVRKMLSTASNESELYGLIQALSERMEARTPGSGPGRDKQASIIAEAKRRKRQNRKKTSEKGAMSGDDEEDEEKPRRRMRKMPDQYD